MTFVSTMDAFTGFIAPMGNQTLGKELSPTYNAASPFPHIVIDEFLPHELLDQFLSHFDTIVPNAEAITFDRAQERFKTSFHPDGLDDNLRRIFYSFNSRPFIKIIENITGIKGLIPDPYFLGAGIHEIKQGLQQVRAIPSAVAGHFLALAPIHEQTRQPGAGRFLATCAQEWQVETFQATAQGIAFSVALLEVLNRGFRTD